MHGVAIALLFVGIVHCGLAALAWDRCTEGEAERGITLGILATGLVWLVMGAAFLVLRGIFA